MGRARAHMCTCSVEDKATLRLLLQACSHPHQLVNKYLFIGFPVVLGFELRALYLLGICSYAWATPPDLQQIFIKHLVARRHFLNPGLLCSVNSYSSFRTHCR
jgi:hypothetical protein